MSVVTDKHILSKPIAYNFMLCPGVPLADGKVKNADEAGLQPHKTLHSGGLLPNSG